MTPEERFERIERHVQFLAQNQAQLTASTSTLKQDLLELARIVQQHVIGTEARFQMVAEQFRIVAEHLESLAGTQRTLAESQRTLTESQRTTEERLNTLIIIVERYFSDGKR